MGRELLDFNGPPWQPKGVGAGGVCPPSCVERRKLEYNMRFIISIIIPYN